MVYLYSMWHKVYLSFLYYVSHISMWAFIFQATYQHAHIEGESLMNSKFLDNMFVFLLQILVLSSNTKKGEIERTLSMPLCFCVLGNNTSDNLTYMLSGAGFRCLKHLCIKSKKSTEKSKSILMSVGLSGLHPVGLSEFQAQRIFWLRTRSKYVLMSVGLSELPLVGLSEVQAQRRILLRTRSKYILIPVGFSEPQHVGLSGYSDYPSNLISDYPRFLSPTGRNGGTLYIGLLLP